MAWTWVPGLVTAAMMNTYIESRLQTLEAGDSAIPWVPLTLGTGIAWTDTQWARPSYRVVGNTVTLRGLAHTTALINHSAIIFTVGADAVPPEFRMFFLGLGETSGVRIDIRGANFSTSSVGSIPSGSFVMLDGVSYTLDPTV